MTKRILLIFVIILTAMLAVPSVRADDFAAIADPDVIISPNCCYPFTQTVVSDTTTKVTQGNKPGATYPYNAVAAWEPFLADPNPAEPNGSYWDTHVDFAFAAAADWIWETTRVVHPVEGDIVSFSKTFSVSGYPTAGTLHITCDNGYQVSLNGHLLGSAGLGVGWGPGNLTKAYVNMPAGDSWTSVEAWDVSALLVHGTNTLTATGVNEYMGPLDGQQLGTIDTNPAGLIFQLDMTYSSCPPTD